MDEGETAAAGADRHARRRQATREELHRHALRLFQEQGYAATTVEQIAAAAGVSHMTFFRHFAAKDQVVLTDDHDARLQALVAQRPHDEPALQMVRGAIHHVLGEVYPTHRDELLRRWRLVLVTPELRARQAERALTTERLIADGLATHPGHNAGAVGTRAAAAAGLACATAASLLWAERDGVDELPQLVDEAFDALTPRVDDGA
ncbi:transcriptional regulator, TetR family [Quadrisphaera granulorum]|uniref:TetR family transcriptional regulator n=1 Tax=Quadrisphaera granulorum TaxID=317664 RepID=A0A315ZU97_9ACTN|nr:TetR family transcriptional regulator [Quadrisphaera granulorum]SZE98445.1 transcriptional regulator, TetR family [Quadrisphaera granulorum]